MVTVAVAVAVLPALSEAAPVTVCDPSAVTVIGSAHVPTPDSASEHVKLTTTSDDVQPVADGSPWMDGGVRSRLMSSFAVELLPALSVTVPLTGWACPSAVTVTGSGHYTMPEPVSAHVNETTTCGDECQPAAFGAGADVATIVGLVRSIVTDAVARAVLPALSIASPVTIWLAPSLETMTSGGHTARPDSPSAHVK